MNIALQKTTRRLERHPIPGRSRTSCGSMCLRGRSCFISRHRRATGSWTSWIHGRWRGSAGGVSKDHRAAFRRAGRYPAAIEAAIRQSGGHGAGGGFRGAVLLARGARTKDIGYAALPGTAGPVPGGQRLQIAPADTGRKQFARQVLVPTLAAGPPMRRVVWLRAAERTWRVLAWLSWLEEKRRGTVRSAAVSIGWQVRTPSRGSPLVCVSPRTSDSC